MISTAAREFEEAGISKESRQNSDLDPGALAPTTYCHAGILDTPVTTRLP